MDTQSSLHQPLAATNIFQEGQVLLINKPYKWTSFDAVNKVKRIILKATKTPGKRMKVGHAGTLDPLATGLLIICTGKFTKRIEEFQAQQKEYTGCFRMGATTPSFDLETEVDATFSIEHLTNDLLRETALKFIGTYDQAPPIFSAVKINGSRAYKLARRGHVPEMKATPKQIFEFELTSINLPDVTFRVVCGKGTYIRSLARDFGAALKTGAHLTALHRTKIGDFNIINAQEISAFENQLQTPVSNTQLKNSP